MYFRWGREGLKPLPVFHKRNFPPLPFSETQQEVRGDLPRWEESLASLKDFSSPFILGTTVKGKMVIRTKTKMATVLDLVDSPASWLSVLLMQCPWPCPGITTREYQPYLSYWTCIENQKGIENVWLVWRCAVFDYLEVGSGSSHI